MFPMMKMDLLFQRMGHIPKLRLQIQFFEPVFPDIDNYQTEYGPVATSSVFPVSVITVCIILAIILCIIFILDISNNSLSYRMLLLFLYNVIRTVAEGSADWYYVSSQAGEFLLFVATGVFFIAECIWGNKRFREIIRLKYIFCRWLNCYH